MTDSEIKVVLAILYDHVRTLHHQAHEMQLIALASKDTLAQLYPTATVETVYKQMYKRHSDATSEAHLEMLASIDADLKDLGLPASGKPN
jgi:hypothetical protein